MGQAILSVVPAEKSNSRSYRFSNSTIKRLDRLGDITEKSVTAILEDAVAHLLGTLERDLPVYLTSPRDSEKRHKRPPDAA